VRQHPLRFHQLFSNLTQLHQMIYRIRFNKRRGLPGWGTLDHVWRIFDEDGNHWLVKGFHILCPCWGAKDPETDDWNIEVNPNTLFISANAFAVFS
jgi:hypothetical protein